MHYTSNGQLEGIRKGNWKLLVKKPRVRRNQNRQAAAKPAQILLFDLSKDIGEQNNLAEQHPDVVATLRERMLAADKEITENARSPWLKSSE